MRNYSIEDFAGKTDSLYRLVIVAARRANQIGRTDSRPLVSTHSRKPTMIALEEILDGKVSHTTDKSDAEAYLE
ncbi:MAG: DNA-directed RNA polymerase subunit omega [Candidatus Hydrogenedentes bacterium]|nr:DNA-directed RNA polymerase subunit omega [Candidatus Hydrogenedentota bacterium]